ncbi:MAG: hypothetical protein AB8B59_01280 [Maribacter sp.]
MALKLANHYGSKDSIRSPNHYSINYDVDRFSFVLSQKIGDMGQFRKNYTLNWNEIITEYLEVGIGDVPHFASQYVFAKALNTRRTSEREEMQTMYLYIVAGVNKMIEMGDLPSSL